MRWKIVDLQQVSLLNIKCLRNIRTFARADVVRRRSCKTERVDLSGTAEVIHLVIEDDAVRGHDAAAPVKVDSSRERDGVSVAVDGSQMRGAVVLEDDVWNRVIIMPTVSEEYLQFWAL